MADTKISALTALTGANVTSADDVLAIVDTSATQTKKITVDEFDTALWNKTAHTKGANYTATRAAGAVAAGTVTIERNVITATTDAGGTSDIRGHNFDLTVSGANAYSAAVSNETEITHGGSSTAANLTSYRGYLTISSTGNATDGTNFRGEVTLNNSGNLTNARVFHVVAPTLSSTGAVTTFVGHDTANIGHATLITNSIGFRAQDFTASLTLTAGFQGSLSAGTGKYNLYMSGTAQNYLAGITGIGVAASATAALNLAASTTGVASLRLAHGSAPSSPVNGDIWTTSAGLYVQINGSTVGPLT